MSNEKLCPKILSRAKISFKTNKTLVENDSNQNINDSVDKNKIKFVRNKVVPSKFIKSKKKTTVNQSENYASKCKLKHLYIYSWEFH